MPTTGDNVDLMVGQCFVNLWRSDCIWQDWDWKKKKKKKKQWAA